MELVCPWPVGWEPEGGCAGLVDEDPGERDEPGADGSGGADWAVEADHSGPAGEVVGEDRAGKPGPVGCEAARWAVSEAVVWGAPRISDSG